MIPNVHTETRCHETTPPDKIKHYSWKELLILHPLFQSLQNDSDATVANLDLILKWLTLRFFDTNTSMLLKVLEYIQAMFEVLAEVDYHLAKQEAVSFISYLVNKVSHNCKIVSLLSPRVDRLSGSTKSFVCLWLVPIQKQTPVLFYPLFTLIGDKVSRLIHAYPQGPLRMIEVAIYSHQADNPLHIWPDVWRGDV